MSAQVLPTFEDPVLLAELVLAGDISAFDALWDSAGGDSAWGAPYGTSEQFVNALAAAVVRRRQREEVGVCRDHPPASAPRHPASAAGGPSQRTSSSLPAATIGRRLSTTGRVAHRLAPRGRHIWDAVLLCIAVPVALTFIAVAGLIVVDAVHTLWRLA